MTQTHNDGRIVLDQLTLPVLELDRVARILYCNAATAALTGVAHAALVGQHIGDVVPEWHGSPLATATQACLQTGAPQRAQGWWRAHWCRVEVSATPQGVLLVGYDLTEDDHTHRRLRESEASISAIMNTIPESLSMLAHDGAIIALNNAAARRLNTTPASAAGTCFYDYFPPNMAAARKARIDQVFATGMPAHFEDTHDNNMYANAIYPVQAEQGLPARVIVFAMNVTQVRQREFELQRNETRYRAIVEEQTELICRFTPDCVLTFVNNAYCRFFAKSPFELLGTSFLNLIPAATHLGIRVHLASLTPQAPASIHEHFVFDQQGAVRWQQWTDRAVYDQHGVLLEVQAVGRDITARKQAEEQLRHANERFNQLAEQSRTVIWEVDAAGLYTYASPMVEAVLGYRPADLVGTLHFYDLHPAEGRAAYKAATLAVFARHAPFLELENMAVTAAGQQIWLSTNGIPLLDEHGMLRGYRGADTDITTRKQAEEARRASEENYRRLIDNSHDIIYTLSAAGVITFVSPAWTALLGHPLVQVVGQPFRQFVHPDDWAGCLVFLQKVIATGTRHEGIEYRVQRNDGAWRWHTSSAAPVWDAAGAVIGFEGFARDITARTHAEKALRERDAMLNKAQQIAHIGSWELDDATHALHWSDETFRIFGYAPRAVCPTLELFLQSVHPHDRTALQEAITAAWASRAPFSAGHRILLPDGEVRLVHEQAEIQCDAAGQPEKWIGTVQDITVRSLAENQALLARKILEQLNCWSNEPDVIRNILQLIQEIIGFDAVGIRMQNGDDFPYYMTHGFSDEFVQAENCLCARNQTGEIVCDGQGNPLLECLCGNVLRGQTNPALPCFTAAGSFWSNATTPLVAATTAADRPPAHLRGRCIAAGYESVALIPLRAQDKIIGLLQLNARQRGRFTLELIRFFEGLGASIGIAFEHKQIEQALAESEQRYRMLYENLPLGTATWEIVGEEFVLVNINQTAIIEASTTADHLLGQSAGVIYHNQPEMLAILRETAQSRSRQQRELTYTGFLSHHTHPVTCTCGFVPPNLILMHVEDISARRRAESRLRHYQRQLRALASQLTLAEERERRGIAAHLHDQVCQTLAAVKLKLDMLTHTVAKKPAVAELQTITAMVDQCLHATRDLSFDLSPPVLYELGLEAALAWLADHLRHASNAALRVTTSGPRVALADDLRALLFIVTREVIMNAIKHAQAREIVVSLAAAPEHLRIVVRDDGRGFAPGLNPTTLRQRHGFGLFSIRERLRHVGGVLQIDTAPGVGTTVAITLPLEHGE